MDMLTLSMLFASLEDSFWELDKIWQNLCFWKYFKKI